MSTLLLLNVTCGLRLLCIRYQAMSRDWFLGRLNATCLFITAYPLKGNSHQILLSEMSLPGVEVLIEKLLPKILGRLGKENPSKRRCEVAFVQRKCAVMSSVSERFLYASYNKSSNNSACMHGSRQCCPVCVRIPELFVRVPKAVLYAAKCCVTSHNTSNGLLGTFQALNIGE